MFWCVKYMAQEKQPPEGRKSDSGSREAKPDAANLQGVDLGAAKGSDLQMSAAAPAAFASLTGYLKTGEEPSQKSVVEDTASESTRAPAPAQDIETSPITTALSGPSDQQALSASAPEAPDLASDIASDVPTAPDSQFGLQDTASRGPAVSASPTDTTVQSASAPQAMPVGSEPSAGAAEGGDEEIREAENLRSFSSQMAENSADGATVIVLPEVGQYGDQISYSFTDAEGNPVSPADFQLVGNVVQVAPGSVLDFEAAETQVFYVAATTPAGTSSPWPITLTVSDTAEALVLDDGGVTFTDTGVAETSITGGAGDDAITGHNTGAVMDGEGGADRLTGGTSGDVLTGGLGDDTLDGGAGLDVAVFSGNWADYTITEAGGVYTVTDNRLDSPDGTDILTNIEVLRFADGDRIAADSLNDAPELVAADGSVTENAAGASVTMLQSTDADAGDKATLAVDDARFEIVNGQLKLRDDVSLDYEADGPSIAVTVTATDSHGATDTQVVTVMIDDTGEALVLDDGGVVFTDTGVTETSITGGGGDDTITGHIGGAVMDGASGDDVLTGNIGNDSLTGGAGSDVLDGGAGDDVAFFTGAWADYRITEVDGAYTVTDLRPGSPDGTDTLTNVETLDFADGSLSVAEALNDAPKLQAESGAIAENDAGAAVGPVAATDADAGDAVILTVDDARFEVADGQLKLRDGVSLDYEADGSEIAVTVTATDSHGATDTQIVTVAITDTGEALVLDDGGVVFTDRGVTETSVTGGAGDDTITGHADGGFIAGAAGDDALTGGAGNDSLAGGTGDDTLEGGNGSDTAVWDGGLADFGVSYDSGTDTFTFVDRNAADGADEGTDTVTGVESFIFDGEIYTATEMQAEAAGHANTGPGGAQVAKGGTVDENSAAGTTVAVLTANDADGDALTYTVTDADGNPVTDSNFEIIGDEVRVRNGADLNYENATSHSLYITASDAFETSAPQAITVTVSDVAETIRLGDGGESFVDDGVAETSITGGTGDDRIAAHQDGGEVYGGDGNDDIAGRDGDDRLSGGAGDDTIDGGEGSDTAVFAGNLTDFSVSYDRDTETFEIDDLNAGDGDAGTDLVSGVETFEFNGTTYTLDQMITEADRQANTGPGSPSVASGGTVNENSEAGTVVATLAASDADGDTLTYAITDTDGNPVTDSNFEIIGNEIHLRGGADLDYETATSHSLYVTASDAFDTSAPQAVTVTVIDVAENIFLEDGGVSITDTSVVETSITGGSGDDTIIAHDNGGDLAGGGGNDRLEGRSGDDILSGGDDNDVIRGDTGNDTIDGGAGTDRMQVGGALSDYAVSYDGGTNTFTLTDQNAADGDEGTDTVTSIENFTFTGEGWTYSLAEMITEADRQANTGPGAASVSSGGSVAENSAAGTVVAVLTASDADGDSLTYALTDADGNPVSDSNFEIIGNEVRVREGADLDYETAASHGLFVTASDTFETSAPQAITVTVNDVAEAIVLSDGGVAFADIGVTETSVTGGSGQDTITGTSGDDNLIGGDGYDILTGGAGDDSLSGGSGYDTLDGGAGNDTLSGGFAHDVLVGGDGSDMLDGGDWSDTIQGDAGNDTLIGDRGADSLTGGTGDDSIEGGTGSDTAVWEGDLVNFDVSYDSGSDTFTIVDRNFADGADEGTDTVTGVETFEFNGVPYTAPEMQTEAARQANTTPGTASLASGGSANENSASGTVVGTMTATDADGDTLSYTITDADGNPVTNSNFEIVGNEIRVRDGADIDYETATSHALYVVASDSFESGTPQQISLAVNDRSEAITLSGGGQTFTDTGVKETSVTGGAGDDSITGSTSADALTGGAGNDAISGEGGSDAISGGLGDDVVAGGTGSDTIAGGEGADELDGGTGNDKLIGGAGNDTIDGGGSDADMAVWSGDLADFSVSYNSGTQTFTIADSNTADGLDEGTDVVAGVETFEFNGVSYTAAEMITEAARQANQAPTQVAFASGGSVNETVADGGTIAATYDPSGVTVATLSTSDADSGDSHSYTLVSDASGKFEIIGNEVRVKAGQTIDYEADTSFDLTIRTTDQSGETHDEVLTLNVINFEGDYTAGDSGDAITGTSEEDTINGGTGADTIDGGAGDDVIAGGGSPEVDALVLLNFNDGGAIATDTSGNDRDGAFRGDAADGGTGWNGQGTGVLLDGDGDFVEIPSDPAFELAAGTVSVRFNVDSLSGEQTIFSRDSQGFDGGGHITTSVLSDGSVEVRLQSTSDNVYLYSDAGSVTAGEWTHVAVSFGPDGAVLFLNGVEVDTNTHTGGIDGNSEPWTLGADQGASRDGVADNLRDFFTGSIDEFAVFDSQLTAAEIAEIEASGIVVGLDELSGGAGNDQVTGGSGTDIIYGGAGNDSLLGGGGSDTVDGGSDNDQLFGEDGADILSGGQGDDLIRGGVGNDQIVGGEDSDTAVWEGDLSDFAISYDAGTNAFQITDLNGGDALNEGSDTVSEVETFTFNGTDYTAADMIAEAGRQENSAPTDITFSSGGAVNETVSNGGTTGSAYDPSGATVATLASTDDAGDTHTYTLVSDPSGHFEIIGDEVRVRSGQTIDIETNESFDVTIRSTDSFGETVERSLTINTTDFEGSFTAGNSGEAITGTSEEDVIAGGDGNDTISGGQGSDSISVGTGNDTIDGGAGADSIDGGAGNDTIDGGDGADSITGGDGNDSILGGSGVDTLNAGAGDDVVFGEGGFDRLYGNDGSDTLDGGSGNDTLYGGDGDDVLDGNADNDRLYGDAGNDTLTISRGADSLDGGDDADTFQVANTTGAFGDDTIIGGEGGVDEDTLDLSGMTAPLTVDYTGNESGTVTDGTSSISFSEIEDIILTDGADVVDAASDSLGINLDAGAGDDSIYGGDGSDSIVGGDGNDLLQGRSGNDTIDGGAGDDVAVFSGTRADYTITESGGIYSVTDMRSGSPDGTDSLTGIETLRFSDGDIGIADALSAAPTDMTIAANSALTGSAGETETVVSGRIRNSDDRSSIDHWEITHAGGDLVVDVYANGFDGSSLNSQIWLFRVERDGSLTQVSSNDDGAAGQDGSRSSTDSYISESGLNAGTYILAIGSYPMSEAAATSTSSHPNAAAPDANDEYQITFTGDSSVSFATNPRSGGKWGDVGDDATIDSVAKLDGDLSAGTVVASVADVTDADGGDSHTFSLTDDAGGVFAIDADTGEISLTGDPRSGGFYQDSISIVATDDQGASYAEDVSITFGNDTADTLAGTAGNDIVYALDGDDFVLGGAGDDTIVGGTSNTGWMTFQNGDNLHGTSNQDFYTWAPEAGDNAVIRFNYTPADSGNSDGIVDYVEVETTNSSKLTIGDFDLGIDQIVLQETWVNSSVTNFDGGSEVVLTYANGNQQGFTLYYTGGSATLNDIFTTTPPEISAGDYMVYAGDFADFDISYNAATGAFTITDGNTGDGLDEGTDTVSDIETFTFNGVNYDASEFMGESGIAAGNHDYDQGRHSEYATMTADVDSGGATKNTDTSDQVIYARSGDDTITSYAGDDVVFAGSGDDLVSTGGGSDTIYGGTGSDWMSGGDGSDTFVVTSLEGSDTIDGGAGWVDALELAGFTGAVNVTGNTVDGEGWTMVLESGHSVTNQTLDSLELTVDSVGVITFDDGGTIDFSGIERINF